jgi:hypothetical protein
MKLEGMVEVGRMQGLVALLRRGEVFGFPKLGTLTVHRCRGATDFYTSGSKKYEYVNYQLRSLGKSRDILNSVQVPRKRVARREQIFM